MAKLDVSKEQGIFLIWYNGEFIIKYPYQSQPGILHLDNSAESNRFDIEPFQAILGVMQM